MTSPLPLVDLSSPSSPPSPIRKIYTQDDMDGWFRSEAYSYTERFVGCLKAARQLEAVEESQAVKAILDFLKNSSDVISEVAATQSTESRREIFEAWLGKVGENSVNVLRHLVSSTQAAALPELEFHLASAFGSSARLDYGTGHELSFVAFLLILRLIGVLTATDEAAIVKKCFPAYRELVEKLQKAFRLEAAGKMGVWGLDEHEHLVYHFGASQSRIHATKRPLSLLSHPSVSSSRTAYLYLSSLLQLDREQEGDVDGLLRLYRSEVLQRLPVVQHFRFGPALRWVDATTGKSLVPSSGDGLSEEEREKLTATLDKRERDSGTVAPWALPALSGEQTPEDILSRLPSPALPPGSPSTPTKEAPSVPPSPASSSGSPLPRPYSAGSSAGLGQRRMSKLSIANAGEGEGEKE
ncbi:hypothetical protein JCM11641_001314 [Rhodosporidiobolus odoratus]